MSEYDWAQVRSFLAVADHGSLTAAAQALHSSQPTIGRHVRLLEAAVGTPLIVRHARGVELTERGRLLAASGQDLLRSMDAFSLVAKGASRSLRGTVRIAATEIVGVYVLVPILAAIRRELPEIEVELALDNTAADLLKGRADIAVRMFQPTEPDLVGRRLGHTPTGMFAARGYLEARGRPETMEQVLAGHDLIGFDPRGPFANLNAGFDPRLHAHAFSFRTDSLTGQLEAARHGLGIAPLQTEIAGRYPELERVAPGVPTPALPVWLLTHEDLRGGAHIQAVFTQLGTRLGAYLSALRPS